MLESNYPGSLRGLSDHVSGGNIQPVRPSYGDQSGKYAAQMRQVQRDIARTITDGFGGGPSQIRPSAVQTGLLAGRPLVLDEASMKDAQRGPASDKQAFLSEIRPFARSAAAALGVSEDLVAAHAALESGWGQRPIRGADGQNAYNLFGIKAGSDWRGRVADVMTSEFVGGSEIKTVERFRAYPGYQAAFDDYVKLIRDNPRYADVLGAGSNAAAFGAALARGGYATDPAYGGKLSRLAADVTATRISDSNVALAQRAAQPFPVP